MDNVTHTTRFRILVRLAVVAAVMLAGLVLLPAPAASAVRFNPCAQLDLSRISDVRNGVTYQYCWIRKIKILCQVGDYIDYKRVRDWKEYRVGAKPVGCKNHW